MKNRDEDSWQEFTDKDSVKTKSSSLELTLSCTAWWWEALLEIRSENDTLEAAVFYMSTTVPQ